MAVLMFSVVADDRRDITREHFDALLKKMSRTLKQEPSGYETFREGDRNFRIRWGWAENGDEFELANEFYAYFRPSVG